MKINILSSDIYNKIAAGEVVERPASVVKELVENSIDAGATKIEINIYEGGIKQIVVIDNGCGISDEEIGNAFLPHATSKISCADDLNGLQTLGFRGEALASISSVSKVVLVSKTSGQELGTKIVLQAGREVNKERCSSNVGTNIAVSELFYNTPARKKFLKTYQREASEVTNFVSHLIFANPNIELKYSIDDELIYNFHGKGVEEAIHLIYGSECLAKCIGFSNNIKNIKIYGLVSQPDYYKGNSTYQTIVVNGRYVCNSTISSAIKNAYKSYLMTRQYPVYVIYVEIDKNEIDVNVHPSKLEIRFADGQSAYLSAFLSVRDALCGSSRQGIDKIVEKNIIDDVDYQNSTHTYNENNVNYAKNEESFTSVNGIFENKEDLFQSKFSNDAQPNLNNDILNGNLINDRYEENKLNDIPIFSSNQDSVNTIDTVEQTAIQLKYDSEQVVDRRNLFSTARFVGILFNTYIILERGDFVFLVDQHAAHERILYDKYIFEYNKGEIPTQPLLVPYLFDVSDNEANYLQQNLQEMNKGGFEIEMFGIHTFKLNSVPLIFAHIEPKSFIQSILEGVQFFDIKLSNLNSDLLAKRACKAAIKSGDSVNGLEVTALTHQLDKLDELKCPHGRPVVIIKTRIDFEKMFKRIV